MNRAAVVTLSEQDLRRAHRLHVLSAMRSPRTLTRLGLLWLFAVLAWTGLLLANGLQRRDILEAIAPFAAGFAIAVFVFPTVLPLALGPLKIRQRFRQEKQLSEPAEISWDDDAYEVRTRITQNRVPWGEYRKSLENGAVILLFLSDGHFQTIPKRFLTAEQVADIRARLPARA